MSELTLRDIRIRDEARSIMRTLGYEAPLSPEKAKIVAGIISQKFELRARRERRKTREAIGART